MNNKYIIKKIPNILTSIRILCVIGIGFLILLLQLSWKNNSHSSTNDFYATTFYIVILFIIGSLTDYFDGYIARKYNAQSQFGEVLDPIADKLLFYSILLYLFFINYLVVFVFVIFLIRDFWITIARKNNINVGKGVSANLFGKLKTVTFFGVGIVIFIIIMMKTYNKNVTPLNISDYLSKDYILVFNLIFIIPLFFSYWSLFTYIDTKSTVIDIKKFLKLFNKKVDNQPDKTISKQNDKKVKEITNITKDKKKKSQNKKTKKPLKKKI